MSNKRVKKIATSFLVSALYQRSGPIYAISRAEKKNINNRNDKNANVVYEDSTMVILFLLDGTVPPRPPPPPPPPP